MFKNILEKLFGQTEVKVEQKKEVASKLCSKCGTVKAISSFSRHSKKRDGLQVWCRDCAKHFKVLKKKTFKRRSAFTRMKKLKEGQVWIKLSFQVTPEQRVILDQICREKKITVGKLTNSVMQVIVDEYKTKKEKIELA